MKRLVLIAGLCAPFLGCSVIGNGFRTLVGEPLTYCAKWEENRAKARYRAWADDTWKKIQADEPGRFSPAYACGFKDGFVDYLDAGGNGEPPALPPRKYWQEGYENPAGHAAIRDWFAGFRHGAAVACQTGARRCATVPTSVACRGEIGPWPAHVAAPASTLPTPAAPLPPPTEVVPTPPADPSSPPSLAPPTGDAGMPWPANFRGPGAQAFGSATSAPSAPPLWAGPAFDWSFIDGAGSTVNLGLARGME